MMKPMSTPGEVRIWHDEEGWGVVDSPETPGGCWAHWSAVAVYGFASLHTGQLVELEWESAQQDGFEYRAVRVWPRGAQPYERPIQPIRRSTAYESSLTISFDPDPTSDAES
jgi:cold shock protein